MGVKKYRSVSEMPGRRVLPPLDPENLWRALELCALTDRLFPVHREPGVRKFRSLQEATRHRQAREAEAIRRRLEENSSPARSEPSRPAGQAARADASDTSGTQDEKQVSTS